MLPKGHPHIAKIGRRRWKWGNELKQTWTFGRRIRTKIKAFPRNYTGQVKDTLDIIVYVYLMEALHTTATWQKRFKFWGITYYALVLQAYTSRILAKALRFVQLKWGSRTNNSSAWKQQVCGSSFTTKTVHLYSLYM